MLSPLKVLILEDRASDAKLMVHELRQAGYEPQAQRVDTEVDFTTALAEPWDVVFVDYQLPNFNGLAALKLCHESAPHVPVIVVTGSIGEELAARCMREGAVDYVLKSSLERLAPAVRRARLERHVRAERDRLFNFSVDMLCIAGLDGFLKQVNPAWTKTLGWSEEQLLARPWLERVHPADLAATTAAAAALAPAPGFHEFICRFQCADGTYRWISWRSLPVPAEGVAFAVARDITAQREAEEKLRLNDLAFRTISQGVLIAGLDRNILSVNAAFTTITGYTEAEVLGRNCRFLQGAESAPEIIQTIREALERQEEFSGEIINYRKNGNPFWNELTISPARDATGTVTHYIGITRDITARKQIEEQFRRAQRMESIGTLASGVAHDLNNILTPLLLATGTLRSEIKSAHGLELINMVERSTQRGAGIIRQLLSLSRGYEGQPVNLQLRHLIGELKHLMQETFPRQIELHIDVAKDLWLVTADATQLHQVLLNLCVNARDAMPGGGHLTLAAHNVTLEESAVRPHPDAHAGPHVELTVTDTGHGIPPEIIDRIFDPFFTTKPLGKGTGLGLATVAGIVKNHHGFVTVRSRMREGAVFKIYLPAAVEQTPLLEQTVSDTALHGRGETILVVDDEAPIRLVLRQVFERHGYRVLLAAQGEEAIAVFASHRSTVRLVVTDLMMPGMDGLELIAALRRMDARIEAILCSGLNTFPPREKFAELGLREVIAKPFVATVLLHAVREALVRENH